MPQQHRRYSFPIITKKLYMTEEQKLLNPIERRRHLNEIKNAPENPGHIKSIQP